MVKKSILILITAFILGIGVGTGIYFVLKSQGAYISTFAIWNKYTHTYTIGSEQVTFTLKKKKLTITDSNNSLLYDTPDGVYVSDAFCQDIDRDGAPEIILMTWKRGSYDKYKPIWITEDTDEFTQHIFIYDWDSQREDRLDPLWMSSALGIKVRSISIDKKNRIHLTDTDGKETVWEWGSWGLVEAE